MSVLQANVFVKVLFSASNLNGLAAMFLSYSLGSIAGTLIFAAAALIGCINKYRSLIGKNNFQNFWLKRLTDPSLTAQILMAAAGMNAIMAVYNIVNDPENMTHHIFLMIAWSFGVLGDDALRRNDKTNFSDIAKEKLQKFWLKTLIYVTRNPIFYYMFVNIFFSLAILIAPMKSAAQNGALLSLTILAITLAVGGIIYAIRQGYRMLTNKISAHQTNNGISNFMMILINVIMGTMAYLQGLEWLILSQILFCASNIMIFFETQNALAKEYQ